MAYTENNKMKIYDDIDSWSVEPSLIATNEEKESPEYGLSVAKKIEKEWFYQQGGSARFYDKREEYERLRLYARGEQSTDGYKKTLEEDGDLSYLNIDWEPVPILAKFVDIIVNGMQDRGFKVKAKSIDPFASAERDRYKARLQAEMKQFQELIQLQQEIGNSGLEVDVFEERDGEFPHNQDELEVHLDLEYKQGVEIAAEEAIDYFMKVNNHYEEVKQPCDRDLVEIGISAATHLFDANKGIIEEYVDPIDLIHSDTNSATFNDLYYSGYVKSIPISKIEHMFPHLDPANLEEIKEIGRAYDNYQGLTNGTYRNNSQKQDDNFVQVLFFYWKTNTRIVDKIGEHRKYGTKQSSRKDESFNGPKTPDAKFSKSERIEECIYEGVKVLGDGNRILKWQKAKNMVRKASSDVEVEMPIIISAPNYYRGRVDSPVKRMLKYADLIQIAHIKIQQVLQRINPGGVYIDADGLAEIDLGNGTNYNPAEALKMYFQTGSVIGRSRTVDGDPNRANVPIQELSGNAGAQLESLFASYNFYVDQIRQVVGINEIREGQSPDERALVGVQKLAAANSNQATRHLIDASIYRDERLAEGISLRFRDIIEYGKKDNPKLYNNLIDAISNNNVAKLEDIQDQHLHDFGIFLELAPDEEEKLMLEQNIQQALGRDQIAIEDAIMVRSVNNIKLANNLLAVRRRRKQQLDQITAERNIQAQTQANVAANQAAEQVKAQTQKLQTEGEILKQREAHKHKMEQLAFERQAQKELMQHEWRLQQSSNAAQAQVDRGMQAQKNEGEIQKEKAKKEFESKGYDTRPNNRLNDKSFGV